MTRTAESAVAELVAHQDENVHDAVSPSERSVPIADSASRRYGCWCVAVHPNITREAAGSFCASRVPASTTQTNGGLGGRGLGDKECPGAEEVFGMSALVGAARGTNSRGRDAWRSAWPPKNRRQATKEATVW